MNDALHFERIEAYSFAATSLEYRWKLIENRLKGRGKKWIPAPPDVLKIGGLSPSYW